MAEINRLEVKNIPLYNYRNKRFICTEAQPVIDGIPLGEHINIWAEKNGIYEIKGYDCKLLQSTLVPELDDEYCNRFMEMLLKKREAAVIPVMVCDDDRDFSCLILTVRLRFDNSFVYWDEIGYVCGKREDDRAFGISYIEGYSERDWELYGNNIALEEPLSSEWKKWVEANTDEELFRRLVNYHFPFWQKRENVETIFRPQWKFKLDTYEKMLCFFRKGCVRNLSDNDLPML